MFSSLAIARHVRRAGELNVDDVERGQLGGAQPGLERTRDLRVMSANQGALAPQSGTLLTQNPQQIGPRLVHESSLALRVRLFKYTPLQAIA